jgi:predicted small secreted protein
MRRVRNIFVTLVAILLVSTVISALPTVRGVGPPKITLLPPAGPVETPINIEGTDFKPGSRVDLTWFGYIIDVPGIKGHIGYYPIGTGVTVGSDGNFITTIVAPYDFTDITHFVNATQDGVGTGIVNATFTIIPSLLLEPQPTNYTDGQEIILHVYGGPLGTPALMMKLSPRLTIIKFTYDNTFWGYATSHLETEGPIVTGGFVGGDIGGNITIRFKAVGGPGQHDIRGYTGDKETPPYLSCEIGGEAVFNVVGSNPDTQSILEKLGTVENKTDSLANYGLGLIALSIVNLVILLAVAVRVLRKSQKDQP